MSEKYKNITERSKKVKKLSSETPQNAIKIIEKVWGANRLSADSSRSGAIDDNSLS